MSASTGYGQQVLGARFAASNHNQSRLKTRAHGGEEGIVMQTLTAIFPGFRNHSGLENSTLRDGAGRRLVWCLRALMVGGLVAASLFFSTHSASAAPGLTHNQCQPGPEGGNNGILSDCITNSNPNGWKTGLNAGLFNRGDSIPYRAKQKFTGRGDGTGSSHRVMTAHRSVSSTTSLTPIPRRTRRDSSRILRPSASK